MNPFWGRLVGTIAPAVVDQWRGPDFGASASYRLFNQMLIAKIPLYFGYALGYFLPTVSFSVR